MRHTWYNVIWLGTCSSAVVTPLWERHLLDDRVDESLICQCRNDEATDCGSYVDGQWSDVTLGLRFELVQSEDIGSSAGTIDIAK